MTPPAVPAPDRVLVLRPARRFEGLGLAEVWRHRDLLRFLAARDVKVRYKQTALGVAWAVLQPLFTMVIFSVFFGRLAGIERTVEGGLPYPVFALCALLPWQLFSYALTASSQSLVSNERLISKVYFPRLVVPLASVGGGLVDFAVAFVLLFGVMLFYGITPSRNILLLPLFVVLAIVAALAVGVWLSLLSVVYRDVRYAVPFLTQVWLFLSPVAYSSSLVPERWRTLYGLNPLVGVIDGFRLSLLGNASVDWRMLAVSATATVALLVGGLIYFRRAERDFADWM